VCNLEWTNKVSDRWGSVVQGWAKLPITIAWGFKKLTFNFGGSAKKRDCKVMLLVCGTQGPWASFHHGGGRKEENKGNGNPATQVTKGEQEKTATGNNKTKGWGGSSLRHGGTTGAVGKGTEHAKNQWPK